MQLQSSFGDTIRVHAREAFGISLPKDAQKLLHSFQPAPDVITFGTHEVRVDSCNASKLARGLEPHPMRSSIAGCFHHMSACTLLSRTPIPFEITSKNSDYVVAHLDNAPTSFRGEEARPTR